MFRIRAIVLSGAVLAFTATCSSPPPVPHSDPRVQRPRELAAVALGVAIDASDDRGAPRLIRAVALRPARAGMTHEQAARDHLVALTQLWIEHAQVSDLATLGVQRLRNGASVVRLQQQVDGVDIDQGELRVMVQPDGSLAAISGTLRAISGRASFRSTATAALDRALDALYGAARARPAITEASGQAGYRMLGVADDSEVRVSTARARPALFADGDQLVAIWSLELLAERSDPEGVTESVARRFLIGDGDGRIVREIDLTASDAFSYRVFADPAGTHNPLDGALASFNPHPTGLPDSTVPPPVASELVVMEAFNQPRDPWLPASATTTSGNNVDAFADIAAPVGFSAGDIRPELSSAQTFDHRYDFTAEPLATAAQSKAAAVNLFFVTNWLHDWYYDSGFTEVTGNAQVDNFGRGGIPGDPLIAQAQAGALAGSRDNANMTVPSDGMSPVMNMFLWTGRADTLLTAPTGTPSSAAFATGPRMFDLTATAVLVQDRTGGTHRACGRINSVSGRIAVFEFDNTCNSAVAMTNIRSAGAIGAIGVIAIPGIPVQPLTGSAAANLPGLVLGLDDGRALEATLPAAVTLHRTTTIEHDGDFDNAVISHEWGHYLHHRLASCSARQCSAMGEGWGDFTALHMMLGPDDDSDGTFGVGLYALTAGGVTSAGLTDPGYFGIRRFPYSVRRTKGLSFRHISDGAALPDVPTNPAPAANPNSEVHNAGEIWAAMLWDAYHALLHQHPYAEARRRMSNYVVAGLLLTPPDATFTEARDAILAAAEALDPGDMTRIAEAFAARGAGTCAVAPARTSTSFAGVVESSIVAPILATSGISLADDAVSCDRDGYLDPGETGMLRVTLANNGFAAAHGVVITSTTSSPGVILGPRIEIADLAARSQVDLAIPVQLSRSAPRNAGIDVVVRVESDAGCSTSNLVVEQHRPIGVDEQAALATIDRAETELQAWTPAGDDAGARWNRIAEPTGNHVLRGTEAAFISDTQLVSPVLQVSPTDPLVVTLKHSYNIAATQFAGVFFNGGVIEISNDSGTTWQDVRAVGVDPHYPGTISIDFLNPLAGRRVFGGKNPSFPDRDSLTLNFGTQFAGQAVQLRFRIGTDSCCAGTGWQIDDIAVSGITNTPFPGFIDEPTQCLGGSTGDAPPVSRVQAARGMPGPVAADRP